MFAYAYLTYTYYWNNMTLPILLLELQLT
jgi:hypothetical protein